MVVAPDDMRDPHRDVVDDRSEEHTSELQSPCNLVCRLLLEKKKPPLPTIPLADPKPALVDLARHWRARRSPDLIAITGPNGKPHLYDILAEILRRHVVTDDV